MRESFTIWPRWLRPMPVGEVGLDDGVYDASLSRTSATVITSVDLPPLLRVIAGRSLGRRNAPAATSTTRYTPPAKSKMDTNAMEACRRLGQNGDSSDFTPHGGGWVDSGQVVERRHPHRRQPPA